MNKRIGIYVPYSRQERTLAAFELASELVSQGHNPLLIATEGVKGRPWGSHWDARIANGRPARLDRHFQNCDKLFWFSHRPELLKQARKLGIKNIFVGGTVQRSGYDPRELRSLYELDLHPAVAEDKSQQSLLRWPLPSVEPIATHDPHGLCILLDAAQLRNLRAVHGALLMAIARDHPQLPVRVLILGSSSRSDLRELQTGAALAATPVQFLCQPTLAELDATLRASTAAWVLSDREDYGIWCMRALACGVPVLAASTVVREALGSSDACLLASRESTPLEQLSQLPRLLGMCVRPALIRDRLAVRRSEFSTGVRTALEIAECATAEDYLSL